MHTTACLITLFIFVTGFGTCLEFDPPTQNFTQQLNHNSNDNSTFQQRYQLDTRHFKPGGPILFHQSEEVALAPLSFHVYSDYAPKLGAMVVSLEHRYFGQSFPVGLSDTSNITTEQFAPLTLDNVLLDSVKFLNFIRDTVPGAANSKIIHSAGSYGGTLSALARIRHPETFYASIAMSPALTSFGVSVTLQDNPFKFAATDWVANVYWDTNANATRKIRDALEKLDTCIKANNCAVAIPDLNLCTQPSGQLEWQVILSAIISEYILIAQFDFAIRAIFPANPMAFLVDKTLKATSPGEILGVPIIMAAPGNITSCVNWAALTGTGVQNQVAIGASWQYIICQYFALTVSAVSPDNSLFPPQLVDAPGVVCPSSDWVAPDFNATNEQWRTKFNFTDNALDQVTRLLITHGASDRTTAVGIPRLSLSSDRNHSRVIVALGVGHTEQSFPETVIPRGVKPQLDLLRDVQLAYIQEWLDTDTITGEGSGSEL